MRLLSKHANTYKCENKQILISRNKKEQVELENSIFLANWETRVGGHLRSIPKEYLTCMVLNTNSRNINMIEPLF